MKKQIQLYMKKDGKYYLTFKVQLQFIKPYGANWQIYVNAENGSIIDSYNAVTDADSPQKVMDMEYQAIGKN